MDSESLPAPGSDVSSSDEREPSPPSSTFASLQRRAVVAHMLGVPAHVLGSSLKHKAAYRLAQARRKSDRAALYLPALRASATSALITVRDTARTLDWANDRRKLNVGISAPIGQSVMTFGDADGECHELESESVDDARSTPGMSPKRQQQLAGSGAAQASGSPVALQPRPAAHESAQSPMSWNRSHATTTSPVAQLDPNQRTADSPAAEVGGVPNGIAALPQQTAAAARRPQRRSTLLSARPDPVLLPLAWRRLTSATDAATEALAQAKAHNAQAAEGSSSTSGGSGMRAKLRQNDTAEVRREVDGALEDLRDAVSQLPVHRVARYLATAPAETGTAAAGSAPGARKSAPGGPGQVSAGSKRLVGGWAADGGDVGTTRLAEGQAGGIRSWFLRGSGRKQQSEMLSPSQLAPLAFELLHAHMVLSQPHPLSDQAAGSSAGSASTSVSASVSGSRAGAGPDPDEAAAANYDTCRVQHRRAALLLMDSVLPCCGLPPLPYPELAALAAVHAVLGAPSDQDLEACSGRNAKSPQDLPSAAPNSVLDTMFLLRLVRQCAAAIASDCDSKLRGLGADATWGTRQGTDGADGATSDRGLKTQAHPSLQQQLQQHPLRISQRCEPLDAAVWPLEELAVRATRAHLAAVLAALERCGAKNGEQVKKGAPRWTGFKDAYTEILLRSSTRQRQSGAKARGATATTATPAVVAAPQNGPQAAGDALWDALLKSAVLPYLPLLVEWDGPSTAAATAGESAAIGCVEMCRSTAARPAQSVAGGEQCAVLGVKYGLALGLCHTSEDSDTATGEAASASPGATVADGNAGSARLERMAMARTVLQAALDGRPKKLVALGVGSLLSVVVAVSTVGRLRQAALPHPGAVRSHAPGPSSAVTTAGPLLLRFELPPESLHQSGSEPRAGGGAGGGTAGRAPQPPEEFLGRLAVTVVPRSAAAAQVMRRLRMLAQESRRRGHHIGPVLEVPEGGFTLPSQGRGKRDGASQADYMRRMQELLVSHGCARLQCPSREALQAAALLVAQVHQEMLQQDNGRVRLVENSSAAAGGEADPCTLSRLASGLEVLPFIGHRWCEERIRDASDRILQDLKSAIPLQEQPPHQQQHQAHASNGHLGEAQSSACEGLLEAGWEAIRRLSINREACALMGLQTDWCVSPVQLAKSQDPPLTSGNGGKAGGGGPNGGNGGGGSGNGSAPGPGTVASAWPEGKLPMKREKPSDGLPEVVGLLVLKRRDLELA